MSGRKGKFSLPKGERLARITTAAGAAWAATGLGLALNPGTSTAIPFAVAGAVTLCGFGLRKREPAATPLDIRPPLPRTRPKSRASRVIHIPESNPDTPPPIRPHPRAAASVLRALVIDDNPVSQKICRHILNALGYEVVMVADAGSAVVALSTDAASLVLAKQPMDAVDGRALRAHAAQIMGDGEIPLFVALIMAGSREQRSTCLNSGFDEVITQPITPTALRAILERDKALGTPVVSETGIVEALTLDPAVLAEFGYSIEDRDELEEFLTLFLSEAGDKITLLDGAISRADWPAVTRCAHALKGSSGVTGAVRLSKAAAKLEAAGKSADADAVSKCMEQVSDEFHRVEGRFAANRAA